MNLFNADLIPFDLSMSALGGLDALPTLRKLVPSARILILTMHDDAQYLRQALKHSASGYILKKAADSELLSAMRSVLRGEVYVHPSMTRSLLEDMLPEAQSVNKEDTWGGLSEREQEVIKMVALGHTSAEIADQLNLSAKTVETYRARGMETTRPAHACRPGEICTAKGGNQERLRDIDLHLQLNSSPYAELPEGIALRP